MSESAQYAVPDEENEEVLDIRFIDEELEDEKLVEQFLDLLLES